MSGSYMRLVASLPPQRMYGFEKKSATEVADITSRLQRRTYNSELYHGTVSPPYRRGSPSPVCRRAPGDPPGSASGGDAPRRVRRTEREVDRIFRRLRTPTISHRVARGEITPLHELGAPPGGAGPGEDDPRSRDEEQKGVRRVLRPTTASRQRSFCAHCSDPDLEEWHDVDWTDDRPVNQEELDDIIKRVTTPTIASEGGKTLRCRRRKDSVPSQMETRRRQGLPLVSGMPRSRDTDEITQRVYRPFERRRAPSATAVVHT